MTNKIETLMDSIMLPLSWMPDFMLAFLNALIGIVAIIVIVSLVCKVVEIFT